MSTTRAQATSERSVRLEARITKAQKDLFKQAAALQGRTVNEFVVQAATDAAAQVVEEREVFKLTPEEQLAFAEGLLGPIKPCPRLQKAARYYRKVMGE